MSDALPAERHYIAIADDEAKRLGLEQDACPAPSFVHLNGTAPPTPQSLATAGQEPD